MTILIFLGTGDSTRRRIAEEVIAWALMGANVFLGLRFGVWGEEDPEAVADIVNRLLRDGLAPR